MGRLSPVRTIDRIDAQTLALTAQGLGKVALDSTISDAVYRLGALQLDFVSRIIESHYLVLASRGIFNSVGDARIALSSYSDVVEGEYHAASLLCKTDFLDFYPYLSTRRGSLRRSHHKALGDNPWRILQKIEDIFEKDTVASANSIEIILPDKSAGSWWGRKTSRIALDALHFQGRLAIHHRDKTTNMPFYCRPELLGLPTRTDFTRSEIESSLDQMVLRSVESLGCGSMPHIADFYRLSVKEVRASINRLVSSGKIIVLQPTFDHSSWFATISGLERLEQSSISDFSPVALSPFDSLIWQRARTEALFQFHYVNTMYYSREKRRLLGLGYYVLPILSPQGIVARVDVGKSEGRVKIIQYWKEPGFDDDSIVYTALENLASWLGTELEI